MPSSPFVWRRFRKTLGYLPHSLQGSFFPECLQKHGKTDDGKRTRNQPLEKLEKGWQLSRETPALGGWPQGWRLPEHCQPNPAARPREKGPPSGSPMVRMTRADLPLQTGLRRGSSRLKPGPRRMRRFCCWFPRTKRRCPPKKRHATILHMVFDWSWTFWGGREGGTSKVGGTLQRLVSAHFATGPVLQLLRGWFPLVPKARRGQARVRCFRRGPKRNLECQGNSC